MLGVSLPHVQCPHDSLLIHHDPVPNYYFLLLNVSMPDPLVQIKLAGCLKHVSIRSNLTINNVKRFVSTHWLL